MRGDADAFVLISVYLHMTAWTMPISPYKPAGYLTICHDSFAQSVPFGMTEDELRASQPSVATPDICFMTASYARSLPPE